MNDCERYEMLVSAWCDDELERSEQVELVDHLTACAACRGFYADARGLDGLAAAVRTPVDAPAPSFAVWRRIERSAGARRPATPWRVAAAAMLALGLGLALWSATTGVVPRPSDVEIELGADAGSMSEERFIALASEVLRADRRYHSAMYRVMQQVMQDTGALEATYEGFAMDEDAETREVERVGRAPA